VAVPADRPAIGAYLILCAQLTTTSPLTTFRFSVWPETFFGAETIVMARRAFAICIQGTIAASLATRDKSTSTWASVPKGEARKVGGTWAWASTAAPRSEAIVLGPQL
jgi:hypothetical protein